MSLIIDQLNELNIPTNSVIRAVQDFNERYNEGFSTEQFEQIVQNILGRKYNLMPKSEYARIQAGYVVQEAVTRHVGGFGVDADDVFDVATQKAEKLIAEMPWVFAKPEEEVKLDAAGKPKRKKGAKQEAAAEIYKEMKGGDKKDIIERFMKDLDMSKAGATTYFYNMRKKFGG